MSGPTSQMESFLSLKSTPEMEVNSLQLDQVPLLNMASEQKSIPSLDDTLLQQQHQHRPSTDSPMDPPINHTMDTSLDTLSLLPKQNPDDTIAHIDAKPSSPAKAPQIQAPVKIEQQPSYHDLPYATNPQLQQSLPLKQEAAIATIPSEASKADPEAIRYDVAAATKVSAYARLEFENFIFYVQTLQVILGRKSENDQSHSVDVHLGSSKAISRKHAKIFYNFGTERFELSIQGKNGAFVDDVFVERGATVPLTNKSKIQIGQIVFRFVLPGGGNPSEKGESPSKPLNPSDAVSLKSTLYTNRSNDGLDESGENTPNLTSMDFEPISGAAPAAPGTQPTSGTDTPATGGATVPKKPVKEKKAPRAPKPPKKVYTLEEIPEEYRTKPNCSYSNLIATCLRTHGTPKGMSLAEIYKSIRDIFPYYKYCPDGWQSSVRHNLSLNKAFRKVSKEGKGWLWGLDEEYCAEKEKAKKKQQAVAAAKAKAAAIKIEQQQQSQKQHQQKQLQMSQTTNQFQQQQTGVIPNLGMSQQGQLDMTTQPGIQAKQIPLQTAVVDPHQQIQQQLPLQQQPLVAQMPPQALPQQPYVQQPQAQASAAQQIQQRPQHTLPQQTQQQLNKTPSIQAQLAANRGVTPTQPTRVTPPAQNTPARSMGVDTKKALTHLQQQLVLLSKDLRNLVDKPTISAILTQAIAMTIAQVSSIAKAKGITTDPLSTLIDSNPQQLTKILTVALNAATYKVTNGRIKAPLSLNPSGPSSGTPTPVSTPQQPKAQPLAQIHHPVPQQPVPQQPVQQQQPMQQRPVKLPVQQTVQQPAQQQTPQPSQPPVIQTYVSQPQPQTQQVQQQAFPPVPQQNQPVQQQRTQPVPTPALTTSQAVPAMKIEQASAPAVTTQPMTQPIAQPAQPPSSQSTTASPQPVVGTPVMAPPPPALQKAPELQKSTSSASLPSVPPPLPGVTAQSTPYQQQSTTSSPVVNAVAPQIAQTPVVPTAQPSVTSQISTPSVGSSSIQTPVGASAQQTPQPQANAAATTTSPIKTEATEPKTESASVVTQAPVVPQAPVSVPIPAPAEQTPVPVPVPVPDANTSTVPVPVKDTTETAPDLSFLNDDLNDPEFDKVLESLSKEGTPGLEDEHQKVMDDEELNRLLAQDFGEATKDNGAAGAKRSYDDVDSSMMMDDEVNKMPKIE